MAAFFCQSSWLGIDFTELGVELNPSCIPDSSFYEAFYSTLIRKYPSYENLPTDWKDAKLVDASQLANLVTEPENILSYGCGVGFLESELQRILGNRLYVTDFSDVVLKYNPDFRDTFINISQIDSRKYSHIILNQVSYALTDFDLEVLMGNLGSLLSPSGKMLIGFSPHKSLKFHQKFALWLRDGAPFRYFTPNKGSIANSQGWGWHRTILEMNEIFHRANFRIIETYHLESQIVVELQPDSLM